MRVDVFGHSKARCSNCTVNQTCLAIRAWTSVQKLFFLYQFLAVRCCGRYFPLFRKRAKLIGRRQSSKNHVFAENGLCGQQKSKQVTECNRRRDPGTTRKTCVRKRKTFSHRGGAVACLATTCGESPFKDASSAWIFLRPYFA